MMTAPRSLNSLRSLRPFRQADRAAVLDRLPAALAVLVGAWVLIAYSVGQWRQMGPSSTRIGWKWSPRRL